MIVITNSAYNSGGYYKSNTIENIGELTSLQLNDSVNISINSSSYQGIISSTNTLYVITPKISTNWSSLQIDRSMGVSKLYCSQVFGDIVNINIEKGDSSMPRTTGFDWETDWAGPYISYLTTPNGTGYVIKDQVARVHIQDLYTKIEGIVGGDAIVFKGVTTTPISDGATTSPITIGGESVTPTVGNLVFYGSKEFIWDGSKWNEMGDLSTLGALAYKDSASGTYTPAGNISQPIFTGSRSNVTISVANSTSGNYTPAGSVSQATFTGNSMTATGTFTPSGSVTVNVTGTSQASATVSTQTGTATYTPAGTVSQPSFTGSSLTSSGKFTPNGSVNLTNGSTQVTVSPASSGTTTYKPSGTVSAPTISVSSAGTTATIKNPTAVSVVNALAAAAPTATAPANEITYYSVANETLSLYKIGATKTNSITTSNVTVKTGDATYSATAPTFSGSAVRLLSGSIPTPDSASFTGTEGNVSVTGTPQGTISQPTFTGTGARLVTGNIAVPNAFGSTFTGSSGNVSVSGTPAGSISTQSFTGTKVQISGATTAAGTVSTPTFTGTQATITVS